MIMLVLIIAFIWLLKETDFMRVRLPVGKDKPHYGVGRTMAEWEVYNKAHAKELEKAQVEYAKRQAYIKSHTCPICNNTDDNLLIEATTIKAGNSTCHIRACSECLDKYKGEIEKSQRDNPRKSSFKPCQLSMSAFVEDVRTGSRREWVATDDKGHGYHNTVTEYTTYYHDCLPGKEWLEAHYKDEYPEPTMELSIEGKSLSLNGNYKKGMIQGFMSEYTHKVRAGKKTMTAMNGQQVFNCGGGVYVIE